MIKGNRKFSRPWRPLAALVLEVLHSWEVENGPWGGARVEWEKNLED